VKKIVSAERFLQLAAIACLMALVSSAGCFWREPKSDSVFAPRPGNGQTNFLITPTSSPVGRITFVNQQSQFILAAFPLGQVPAEGALLSIFRGGRKVGEVKVSKEMLGTSRSADILSGSAQEGDEVRAP
jgi:hypothetical protein